MLVHRETKDHRIEIKTVIEQRQEIYETFKTNTYEPAKEAFEEMAEVRKIKDQLWVYKRERCSRFILDKQDEIKGLEQV